MGRPWEINADVWDRCMMFFPNWLEKRGGIVIYENQNFDSSHFGDRSYMPARFIAEEDDELHDAPAEHFPDHGIGMPSLRQQKVDHITYEEFNNDGVALMVACFVKGK